MANVDREGTFRGNIIEYGLQKASDAGSKSLGIGIKVELTEMYDFDNEQWIEWLEEWGNEAYGYVNVVKKDGSLNEKSCQSLIQNAGWSGSLTHISSQEWNPTPCGFSIKGEEYKGKTTHKVAFVNDFDSVPTGGVKTLDVSEAKVFESQYGSALRGLAGAFKRNKATPPTGSKPAAPPAPKKQRETVPQDDIPQDEIPF